MPLSPYQRAAMGSSIAGIGNAFFGRNPFDDYSKYMNRGEGDINQYYGDATGYLDPYRQAGQEGLNDWQKMAGEYQDPVGYYNKIMSGWQMSPSAQARMKTGMDAVRSAMAARGLGGSGNEQKALTDYTQNTINQSMEDYLRDVLGIGRTGLQQYGDMSRMGFQAADQSGQFAMDAGQDLASMEGAKAAAAADQTNANNKNLWGGIGALAEWL